MPAFTCIVSLIHSRFSQISIPFHPFPSISIHFHPFPVCFPGSFPCALLCHGAPRLENWVFASPAQERLKLIDFGLATRIVGSEGHSEGGTGGPGDRVG